MRTLLVIITLAIGLVLPLGAVSAAVSCEAQAEAKKLYGAAKTRFIKNCKAAAKDSLMGSKCQENPLHKDCM
jgi:hypothetical protein